MPVASSKLSSDLSVSGPPSRPDSNSQVLLRPRIPPNSKHFPHGLPRATPADMKYMEARDEQAS